MFLKADATTPPLHHPYTTPAETLHLHDLD
jgi:hypothetical protein